jgi:hypothetical protein
VGRAVERDEGAGLDESLLVVAVAFIDNGRRPRGGVGLTQKNKNAPKKKRKGNNSTRTFRLNYKKREKKKGKKNGE